MPERQPVRLGGQHADGGSLLDHAQDIQRRGTEDRCQLGDGEARPEDRRHREDPAGLAGQPRQPPGHHRDQRLGHRSGCSAGRLGRLAGQGPDQLDHVQRVARRGGGRRPQTRVRFGPRHPAGQGCDRCRIERAERQQVRAARLPAALQALQVIRARADAPGGGQQQRQLARDPSEPVQHQQAGRIRPLQVVDGQHDGACRAPAVDQSQDRLGDEKLGISRGERAAGGPVRSPKHRGDPGRLGVGRGGGQAQAVRDGRERHPHLEFLGSAGSDPGSGLRRTVGDPGEDRRLADAGLAGDEHDLSPPRPCGRGGGSEPLQLGIAAYQRDLTRRRRPATSHMLQSGGPGPAPQPARPGPGKPQILASWRVFAAPVQRSISQGMPDRSGTPGQLGHAWPVRAPEERARSCR